MAIANRKRATSTLDLSLATEPRVISEQEHTQKKLVLTQTPRHQGTCPINQSLTNKCTCILFDVAQGGGTLIPEKHFTYLVIENALSWDGFEVVPIDAGDSVRVVYQIETTKPVA